MFNGTANKPTANIYLEKMCIKRMKDGNIIYCRKPQIEEILENFIFQIEMYA